MCAFCWFLLRRYITMHGSKNVKVLSNLNFYNFLLWSTFWRLNLPPLFDVNIFVLIFVFPVYSLHSSNESISDICLAYSPFIIRFTIRETTATEYCSTLYCLSVLRTSYLAQKHWAFWSCYIWCLRMLLKECLTLSHNRKKKRWLSMVFQ